MYKGFVRDLRRALNHLYDPDFLSRSPLCALFGITSAYDRSVRLQRILEDAIAALKPKTREPANARQWQIHELLAYRYLQQFSQKEVADQLNISRSTLAREQTAALQALALHLWGKYRLADKSPATPVEVPRPAERAEELAWLAVPSPDRVTDPAQTLHDVVSMVQPLAQRYQASLEIQTPDHLPALAVYPAALRQILLSLLTATLHFAQSGRITAAAAPSEWGLCLEITGQRPGPAPAGQGDDAVPTLETARQMAELSGGSLTVETGRRAMTARLVLPTLASTPVLVVDDSADHVELLKRYTANTRYRLFGAQDPQKATEIAEETRSQAIVLDIMMPRCDGWMVLERLRAHPATGHLPIAVCSIVPCSELALSLGADAFLQKPVSQEDLLATLARLIGPEASGPR